MNRYISKSYTTSKNTIDRQYTERGQLWCQLPLACEQAFGRTGWGGGKSEKACRQTFGTRGGVNVFPPWCIAIVFLTRWRSFPSHVVFLRSFCVKPNQVRGNQLQSLIFSSFGTFRVASRNLPFSVIPFTKITRALRKTSSMHP